MGLRPVSVSQLNSYIKRILQTDPILGNVSVIGEVSNLKFHSSGHVYFSLKDSKSTVSCFLPGSEAGRFREYLEEGREVICHGYLYLYERGGRYSLNVKDMEIAGEGRLMAEFRRLKEKLEKEGLFDPARKKPLPSFPSKVAVVTSGTGAAVRDILKIIQNKNDYVDVLIYPVLVQGPNAPGEISRAIDDLNENYTDIDVIITGRGGGSIEELWAFNEEIVARSIFNSKIPVISAVGHEIDFTISDFTADRRAETPTAAAEMAVPDTFKLREDLDAAAQEMRRELQGIIELKDRHLQTLDPEMTGRDLRSRIVMETMRTENMLEGMKADVRNLLMTLKGRTDQAGETLKASDPQLILNRGYSIVRGPKGQIVTDPGDVTKGDGIDITLAGGRISAEVRETEKR